MTNPNDNQSFTNRGANDPLMIKHQPDSLDDILKDFGLEVSGGDFTKDQFLKAKAAIQALIDNRETEAYKKGFIDGGLSFVKKAKHSSKEM